METILNLTQKTVKMLESMSDDKKKQLNKTLDLDFKDQFDALNLNARLFASGKISLDISQYMYNKLSKYDSISLVDRFIVMILLSNMAKLSLKDRLNKNG